MDCLSRLLTRPNGRCLAVVVASLVVLALALTVPAMAAERSCQDPPSSGDPGEAEGAGSTVTLSVSRPNDDGELEDIGFSLVFETGTSCYTWLREAEEDDEVEGPHPHYNAADRTSYADGTFRWTEYGPKHSPKEIKAYCEAGEGGVTKYATDSDHCEDHHDLFLKIDNVSEN